MRRQQRHIYQALSLEIAAASASTEFIQSRRSSASAIDDRGQEVPLYLALLHQHHQLLKAKGKEIVAKFMAG